jgi:F-type H+-transporting ATPase subunit delta
MAELATLARPYANAVFAIAKSAARAAQWSRALSLLAAAVSEPRIREMLESPNLSSEQKAHRLNELCRDELDDRARRFVLVLARNRRLSLLPEISEIFETLRAEDERMLDAEVISAYPLAPEEEERLSRALAARYARTVQLKTRVDQTLIGGAIVRAGDTVVDGSLRGKLQKLSEALRRM